MVQNGQQKERPNITISGPITNNGGTITGDIINPTFNFGNKNTASVEKVKAALQKLFEEGLVTDKAQWYAIYRCLKDTYLAPGKPEDFENYILKLNMEFPLACEKNKYKNIGSSCPRLKIDASAWSSLTMPSTPENNQIIVARRLLELLEA